MKAAEERHLPVDEDRRPPAPHRRAADCHTGLMLDGDA
jgi:hypothetical protein